MIQNTFSYKDHQLKIKSFIKNILYRDNKRLCHIKKRIGYTSGVFDLFHIGHVNILEQAKKNCDFLIVAVTSDHLVNIRKNKFPVIPLKERIKILQAIKYVDKVVVQSDMDKFKAYKKYNFDIMFVGSDWKNTDSWKKIEDTFKKVNVVIKYFPYTKSTSSTKINKILNAYKF